MKRKLSKIYTPYIILIFTFIIPLINTLSANSAEIKSPSYMVKVVDGDSLEINSTRIRLQGIDAPEYTQTCKLDSLSTTPCGQNAIEFIKSFIKDKTVTCISHTQDQYQRELCTCYADSSNINEALVLNGYAISYLSDEYKKAENLAKSKKLGIWATDFIHPRLYRQLKSK